MLIQCPITQEAGAKEGRQVTLITNTVGTTQRTRICLPPKGATLARVGLLNGNKYESRACKSRFLNYECKPEGDRELSGIYRMLASRTSGLHLADGAYAAQAAC